MTLIWIFLELRVCPQAGLECTLPAGIILIFLMAIGFPRKFIFRKKKTRVKRALVRIFNDLSFDRTQVVCSHIPAISLT